MNIYEELAHLKATLDDITASDDGSSPSRMGQAELSVQRLIDMVGDPDPGDARFITDDASTEIPIARTEDAKSEDVMRLLSAPVGDDGRSLYKWLRLRDGSLMLGVFPTGDMYMEFSDAGVCDFWPTPEKPKTKTKIVKVKLALAVDSDEEAADAVNEILREHRYTFSPSSCLLDYAFGNRLGQYQDGPTIDLDNYEEGAVFE